MHERETHGASGAGVNRRGEGHGRFVRLNDRGFAILAVRVLLGVQSLISGLNWWVKLLPFPNISEPVTGPVKHEILRVMVESGWMFTTAKALEIVLGLHCC